MAKDMQCLQAILDCMKKEKAHETFSGLPPINCNFIIVVSWIVVHKFNAINDN